MERSVGALILLFCICACTATPRIPQCGKVPDISQLSSAQRLALADAIHRTKGLCGAGGSGCNFSVMPYQGGQSVQAQLAYNQQSGECAQLRGGNPVYLYDANGKFTDLLPGM